MWFLEGLAQLGSERVEADYRDATREMVLLDAARSGKLLSLQEMARFEGTALDMELVYNQGYSLLRFILDKRRDIPLKGLCATIKETGFTSAFRERYGESIEALYGKWKTNLLSRSSAVEDWPAGERLFDKESPFVFETACAGDDDFIAATWGNDYGRFSIFKKKSDGHFTRVAGDTGMAAKADRETGELWFSKRTYDYMSGVEIYDLYRAEKKQNPLRLTSGARSLAFDAVGGNLVYAKYSAGFTKIISRSNDGTERTLAETNAAVYSISAVSKDTAVLTLGTAGAKRQAAILAGGEIRFLWNGADASDACYAGENRIVFSSAIDGSPQIYWCDLGDNAWIWYQITGASAGARFPTITKYQTRDTLYYSKYENGGYRLYRLGDPFTKAHPRTLEDLAVAEKPLKNSESARGNLDRTSFNPVFEQRPLSLGIYSTERAQNIYDESSGLMAVAAVGLGGSFYDAPGDIGVDLSLDMQVPLTTDQFTYPWITAAAKSAIAVGPTRNDLAYVFRTISKEITEYGIITNASNAFSASSQLQVASNQAIGIQASLASHLDTTSSSVNEFFRLIGGGLRWQLADSPRSVFDPARLGGDEYQAYLGADIVFPMFPASGYYSGLADTTNSRPIAKALGGISFHALSDEGRIGFGGGLEGFSLFGAASSGRYVPNMLPTIGGNGSFKGYPENYALINDLAAAKLEVAFNPFVDKKSRMDDLQRMSLVLEVDGGFARYFDGSLNIGWPLSVAASFKRSYYARPNQESSAYFTVAVPVVDFARNLSDVSINLYAGASF
ncbi:MAG TPA: hypothetical protein DIC34_13700 [Treponema sp.]|nr:MAG: hypothetical protein A2001_04275 [Treponema sp. GWC1_61_84]OHE75644.1 MAG: hypothetical protein A2413_11270 [Treponema sp. RIFOXYC1_FULL_61_9]HCM27577.1 hypothetical protein [Treponema sp.]